MEKQKSSVRYAPEVRERAVRMVLEHAGSHGSQWEAIASIAAKIGCSGDTLPDGRPTLRSRASCLVLKLA